MRRLFDPVPADLPPSTWCSTCTYNVFQCSGGVWYGTVWCRRCSSPACVLFRTMHKMYRRWSCSQSMAPARLPTAAAGLCHRVSAAAGAPALHLCGVPLGGNTRHGPANRTFTVHVVFARGHLLRVQTGRTTECVDCPPCLLENTRLTSAKNRLHGHIIIDLEILRGPHVAHILSCLQGYVMCHHLGIESKMV